MPCSQGQLVHVLWLVHVETTLNGLRTPELWTWLAKPEGTLQFNLSLYLILLSSLYHSLCLSHELPLINFFCVNLCFSDNWPEACIMFQGRWLSEEHILVYYSWSKVKNIPERLPVCAMNATAFCKVLLLQYFPPYLLPIVNKKILTVNKAAWAVLFFSHKSVPLNSCKLFKYYGWQYLWAFFFQKMEV